MDPLSNTAALAGAATLGERLAQRYAERIEQRLLLPGARLPSVRECARLHGLSPSTVVAAYDRLQARGLVEARRQRGFFVRDARARQGAGPGSAWPAEPSPAEARPGAGAPERREALPPPVDATALIRGMFQASPAVPGPGLGTLPETWLDGELLQRALRRAMTEGQASGQALRYGEPAGEPGLRQALSQRLSAELGVAAPAGQIVTTVGATHALDIIARTLLRPGDAVLVDEPGWAVEYARLTRMGMRLLPVPRGADGPDLAVMQALLQQHRPRLYVTVSVLHNPTGNCLSLAAAHQVLKLAEAHELTIVEDDTYAWLAPPHLPRLAALDGLQRTVYVSGFSKILAPDWRVGYVAARPDLAQAFIDTKMLMTLSTPGVLERAVGLCLTQGTLRRHAERVGQRLATARNRVVRLAQDAGCRFVTPPQGLFGWVDTGVDTEVLSVRLAEQGWLIAPGRLFLAQPRASTLMRVNFASAQDVRLWRAFEDARAALHRGGPAGAPT
jgi:DNA-binding transcriptional MocR family regulator